MTEPLTAMLKRVLPALETAGRVMKLSRQPEEALAFANDVRLMQEAITLAEELEGELGVRQNVIDQLKAELTKVRDGKHCVGTDANNDTCGVTFTCACCRERARLTALLESLP